MIFPRLLQSYVCEVGTVEKISNCQPGGPALNHRPGEGINFGRLFFHHNEPRQGR